MIGKVPPQAKELEAAVLGAIMLERSAFDTVSEILRAECFYSDAHQYVFKACQQLAANGIPVDVMTVSETLLKMGQLEFVGGPLFVTRLTNSVVSSASIEAHSRIVLQKFILRELIRVSGEILGEAYSDESDVFDLLDESESKILEISNQHLNNDYTNIQAGLVESLKKIEDLRTRDEHVTGVHTGYESLDHVTHGWQPTDLIILAARPSVGKTAFALNLAKNAAMHPTKPVNVGFFSLEMSTSQLVNRLLSAVSEIKLEQLKTGRIDDAGMKLLYKKGVVPLNNSKIFIDDSAGLNIFQLRSKARRMVNKDKVALIIIDYLQLMSGSERNSNREQEISKISRDLKKMAKQLKVPVIALSQLSREVEKRGSGKKIPQLSDLRESGAIEQDADVVGFLYRPDKEEIDQDAELGNTATLGIKKHRDGALEDFVFTVDNSIQKWTEIGVLNTSAPSFSFTPLVQSGSWRPVDYTVPREKDDAPF